MLSNLQLRIVHQAKRKVGMSEDDYRAMLGSFGVSSSKQLTQTGFEGVMNHFHKLGYAWEPKGSATVHAPADREPALGVIKNLCEEMRIPWPGYADGCAARMYRVEKVAWLAPSQLRGVIAAMTKRKAALVRLVQKQQEAKEQGI